MGADESGTVISRSGLWETTENCGIAEGCGRNTGPQLKRFVRIALGSANELEYQIGLAERLGYLDLQSVAPLLAQIDEVKRMLVGLMRGTGSP